MPPCRSVPPAAQPVSTKDTPGLETKWSARCWHCAAPGRRPPRGWAMTARRLLPLALCLALALSFAPAAVRAADAGVITGQVVAKNGATGIAARW